MRNTTPATISKRLLFIPMTMNMIPIATNAAGAVFLSSVQTECRSQPAKETIELTPAENTVYRSLDPYPVHIDELGRKTAIAPGKLSGILLALELKGIVEQLPGKLFAKVDEES